MATVFENESLVYGSCGGCIVLEGEVSKIHRISEKYSMIFAKGDACDISAADITYSLKKGEFVFLSKDPELIKIKSCSTVWILDFSINETEFQEFDLDLKKVYFAPKVDIYKHLNDISCELSESNAYSNKNILSCRILTLLSEISKALFSISIPADIIGINGFSVKDIAKRSLGYFHGRNCIKIEANKNKNSIVVLENYYIQNYKIDLKEVSFVRLNYYYDAVSKIQNPVCRLRFLSVMDQNGDAVIFEKNKSGHPEFFAPLVAGEWGSAVFRINLEGIYRDLIEPCKHAYLMQMKLDPFGMRLTSKIGQDETMYISSVTFYKKLPESQNIKTIHDNRINTVLQLMNQNFLYNHDLKFYADKCFISCSRFSEWFKNQTGVSPHKYILMKKIKYAKTQLANSDASIKNIAENCGFGDSHYFSRIFTKYSGMSPSEYRKNSQKT